LKCSVRKAENIQEETALSKNAPDLAHVHLSIQTVSGGFIPGPPCQRERREGKRQGEIRMNGRKGLGRKDEGRGGGEGRGIVRGGWCPLNLNSVGATVWGPLEHSSPVRAAAPSS
jgi:hypothetical protein